MPEIFESGELEFGVLVEGMVHRVFTLRPSILTDSYAAAASVAVPENLTADQAASVAYQMAIDDAEILCQIETLGTLDPVPSPKALASVLEPGDMAILRQAAGRVKKKLLKSRSGLPLIDEPSSSSSGPDSALLKSAARPKAKSKAGSGRSSRQRQPPQ